MKKHFLMLLALCFLAVLLGACGETTGNIDALGTAGTVTIHISSMSFGQSSVTLKSGQDLQLINDASVLHIIDLGTWQGGVSKPEQEAGAPLIHDEQLNSNGSITIGPWTTSGTYHLYCPVHLNMSLTVIVR